MSENVNVEDMAVVESEILDEDDVIKLIKPMGDKTELIFNFDKILFLLFFTIVKEYNLK